MLFVSPLFSDGCVIQRGACSKIWGKAVPHSIVLIDFIGASYSSNTDEGGNWVINFNDLAPGGPHTMRIQSEGETLNICDVMIGDIWVCGGQSNMEFPMQDVRHMYPDIYNSTKNSYIRQFIVEPWYAFKAPLENIKDGEWASVTPETLPDFTAVGYFFADYIYKQLHIPIGIISASVGGTPIHAWMGRDMLAGYADLLDEADFLSDKSNIKHIQETEETATRRHFDELDQRDDGLKEMWFDASYDDSRWSSCMLCDPWDEDLREAGVIWFRKTIDIPDNIAGKPATVFFGAVNDADATYINGVKIGESSHRFLRREYEIPALPFGKCTIAVRVRNNYGIGGFTPNKPYHISCGRAKSILLDGLWKYKRGVKFEQYIYPTQFSYKATGLYNGMIKPLMGFNIKGVLWYQGESDAAQAEGYGDKFTRLIQGWRDAWGIGCFPFLFAEISYWEEGANWDSLRQEQKQALDLAETAMIRTVDIGEYNDLHPLNKRDVGCRLAQAAMAISYGKPSNSPFILYGSD